VVHLVDTVEVEPQHVAAYLEVVRSLGMGVMTDAGASLASCATTSSDIGENVFIQVVWEVGDHERWDEIRRDLVLDPRFHEYGSALAALRVGGTRRFFTAAALTPPA
jgi:hypothetical protein